MANTNPYTIDVENQKIHNSFLKNGTWTIEDINDNLPESHEGFDEFHQNCECKEYDGWHKDNEGRKITRKKGDFDPFLIHRGDKWGLKICKNCGAVWPHHFARADYL